MSSLIVKVSKINKVVPHSNPEVHSLDIVEVEGWQCLVKRGSFKTGDKAVYFPPDTLLSQVVSDELGVTNYLDKGRIRTIKLKGEMSFGLVVPPRNPNWEVGTDVADEYGATKYMPPTPSEMLARSGKTSAKYSDMLADHPLFWKYTDLENIKHYPSVIQDGEEVVMTEKCHGCFHSDTKVMMANGEELPISEINAGDMILSFDIPSKSFVPQEVLATYVKEPNDLRWMCLSFENGRKVICTEDHRFLTTNGWKKAIELNEIDDLIEFDDSGVSSVY